MALAVGVALVILAACPHRFDPAAAPTNAPPTGDESRDLAGARALVAQGKLPEADAAFAAFVQAHPDSPLAPEALLERGRIAARLGKLQQARDLLGPLAVRQDKVGHRARYHLGLTLVRLGSFREANQMLLPLVDRASEEQRPGLLAALGQSALALGDAPAATRFLGRLHQVSSRPVEKQWARDALQTLLRGPALDRAQVRALYGWAKPGSLVFALLGQRLASLEAAAGNADESRRILAATAGARLAHHVGARDARVRSSVVGLLLPLGGRYRAAGAELLRGAVEASGALRQGADRLALAIRDSSKDPTAAARELVQEEQVVALVGTLDPAAGGAVSRVAGDAGVPFIALSRFTPVPGSFVAQLLPDNHGRARALARHAAALKLARVMILAPENGYGRAMAQAFAAEAGARVVGRVDYRPGTTSFAELAERLARGPRFDGLFVPDTSHALSLIAPALAREGLWSGKPPVGGPARRKGDRASRAFQLLATADGLGDRLVRAAGRYVQGAVLAPGFYPDTSGDGAGALVRRFQQNQGGLPGLVAALGFDAVEILRTLRAGGARTRTELQTVLLSGKSPVQGMTGRIVFNGQGQRADAPLLYRVQGGRIQQIAP